MSCHKHLTLLEREKLALALAKGQKISQIAKELVNIFQLWHNRRVKSAGCAAGAKRSLQIVPCICASHGFS